MGGAAAPVSVSQSVDGLRTFIAKAGPEQSGHVFAYDGEALPW